MYAMWTLGTEISGGGMDIVDGAPGWGGVGNRSRSTLGVEGLRSIISHGVVVVKWMSVFGFLVFMLRAWCRGGNDIFEVERGISTMSLMCFFSTCVFFSHLVNRDWSLV